MRKTRSLTFLLVFLFIFPPATAQTKSTQLQKVQGHPFYEKMNFLGGVFNDPRNLECGTGFIGWVQYDDQAPELIFVEDVFRRVNMSCSPEDLKKDDVSCLSEREITFSHTQRGHTYKSTLKLMNKNVQKPLLQLERFVDGKRILLCNYRKVH